MGKANRTKQYILETAAVIVNEKGISGTTIDDVLAAAQVARGCLYSHFKTKEILAQEVADYLLATNDRYNSEFINKEKTARGRIYAYLKFNSNPLDGCIKGGCPIFNLAAEADDNFPIIKEKVKKNITDAQIYFANILKTGIENGEFSSSLNAEEFATKLFSSVQGGIMVSRTMGTNKPMLSIIKSIKSELKLFEN